MENDPVNPLTWEQLAEIIAKMMPEQRKQEITAKPLSFVKKTLKHAIYEENELKFLDSEIEPEERFDC